MTEPPDQRSGRHAADGELADRQLADGQGADFARPAGVDTPFAPYDPEPRPPQSGPVVTPQDQAVFGRPAGADEFLPPPAERIVPSRMQPPVVPQVLAEAYGASETAIDGYAPPPGARIGPTGPPPQSPWWKPDAQIDPWRDPRSPYWLGRGAIFAAGEAAQVSPDEDAETDGELSPQPDAADQSVPAGTRARFGRSTLVLLTVLGLLVGAIGGGVGYVLADHARNALHNSSVSLSKTGTPANRPPGSVADIAKRVGPAVVSIAVTTSTSFALGSGVVIDKGGYVLTNNHVISTAGGAAAGTSGSAAGTIVVTFANEATAKAQVVGTDPTSDLAVLKVPSDQLTVAALGDSGTLQVGDPVVAIGSALGLQGTVTTGIVSALNRAVHVSDGTTADGVYLDAIQTDAAINHGNSGGALVDASGAVVGINSAAQLSTTDANGQQSVATGIGFAIPINYARSIAQQLIRSGKAVHASLGAQGHSAIANAGLEQGAYIVQISPGGAAAKAGLQVGDVVVVADSKVVQTYDDLVVIVQSHKPGDSIALTYYRGAAKQTATVTLGSA